MNALTKNGCRAVCCAAQWFLCSLGLFGFALSANPANARQPPSPAPAASPQPSRLAKYPFPGLPGWSRMVKRRPARVHTITRNGKTRRYKMPAQAKAVYTRTVDGVQLMLSLDVWDWERPLSATEMLQGLQAAQKIETMMSGIMAKKTGGTSTPMQIKSETYRGLPAYVVTQNFTDKQGVVTETRGRNFVDKMSSYDQQLEIKGVTITNRMRAVANDGWQKLSGGLHTVK